MKINLFKILLCALWLNIFSCSNQKSTIKDNKSQMGSLNYQKSNYDSTILLIDKKIGTMTFGEELLTIDEFKNLYEHDSLYVNDAIDFLLKDSTTLQQKAIAKYSMLNLDIDNYLKICKVCKSLYDKDKIPEYFLKSAINPNFLKKYPIIRNYDNANVIAFLQTIKSDEKVSSEFKQSLDNILSGKSWKDIEKFLEDSGQ